MGPVDVVLSALILGGAAWLLYRTALRSGGGCAGCSERGACRTPRGGGGDVVRLGRRPR